MAIVSDNDLTFGLRGRVGKYLVFRTFGGKTIASHAPRRPDPRKQSDAQRKTRAAFREAAAWAVLALRDPEQRRYFEQRARTGGLTNAYTAAVQQRMRRSGDLDEDRVSTGEERVADEKPKPTPEVRGPEAIYTKESPCRFRRQSSSSPAVKSRDPIPARTYPVVELRFF